MWQLETERGRGWTIPPRGDGEVLLAEDVLAEARRIVLATAVVLGMAWRPGHSIEIEVAPRTWRRYVLAWVDRFTGRAEVIAALGAGGPGAWWAASADTGDPLRLRGARDERLLDASASRHLVIGDETALGFHAALVRWLPASHQVDGLVEVAPWTPDARGERDPLPFAVIPRRVGEPGASLATELPACPVAADTAVYVIGPASLVARVAPTVRLRTGSVRTLVTSAR